MIMADLRACGTKESHIRRCTKRTEAHTCSEKDKAARRRRCQVRRLRPSEIVRPGRRPICILPVLRSRASSTFSLGEACGGTRCRWRCRGEAVGCIGTRAGVGASSAASIEMAMVLLLRWRETEKGREDAAGGETPVTCRGRENRRRARAGEAGEQREAWGGGR